MLIPYNTDAPLYHPPIATVGLIILNVLLFIPVIAHPDPYDVARDIVMEEENGSYEESAWEDEDFEAPPLEDENGVPYDEATQREHERQWREFEEKVRQQQQARRDQQTDAKVNSDSADRSTTPWRLMTLEFGKFRPWQWLTANYMHAGILHLLGNMFVLWGFGLVVEGKIGWWRFLLLYNGIGIAGWALVQLMTIFASEGLGLGASLAIFGIMVVALVWAPANEMQCIFMAGIRPIPFEASITNIAIGAVFLQAFISILHISFASDLSVGLRITSELLHLIGGVFGFAVGVYMVKRNWVDCENWDMFSVMAGKHIRTREEDRADVEKQLERIKSQERRLYAGDDPAPRVPHSAAPTTFAPPPPDQQQVLLERFRSQVAAGQPLDAWMTFCQAENTCFGWQVPEPDFVKYVGQLRKQKLWDQAAQAMEEYLRRYFERETTIRLLLAQVYLLHLSRPQDAWQTLQPIDASALSPEEKSAFDKVQAACQKSLPSLP